MKVFVIVEKGKSGEENYGCYCPDVPGCGTTGQTFEEALENIKVALNLYFEDEEHIYSFRSADQLVAEVNFDRGDVLASVDIDVIFHTAEAA